MKRTAILIDGGFFVNRIEFFRRKYFANEEFSADHLCQVINRIVSQHLQALSKVRRTQSRDNHTLYRIYFYDCPPPQNQLRYPLPNSGQRTPSSWDTTKHPPYVLRRQLHECLRKNRKTALRLGTLSKQGAWQLNSNTLTSLLKGEREWASLTNNDFHFDADQKMVDTKLGVDISTLALEKLVDTVVLVAGDSDFVPAAKLARQRGVDFLLDPMWAKTTEQLSEHVDGIQSHCLVSILKSVLGVEPSVAPAWWRPIDDKSVEVPPELAIIDESLPAAAYLE